MNKIIHCFEAAETTAECVDLINREYKQGKWKRKSKFMLPAEYEEKSPARVFSDGNEFVTIRSGEECTYLCPNLDLSALRPLINDINKHAKNFYTHDYGQIYLNPYTLELWVSGGDGGIGYSTKPLKQAAADYEDFDDSNFVDKNFEELIPQIKSTRYEAEYSPEYDGSDGDWIPIGKIIDICDI